MSECNCGGSLFSHDPDCATNISQLESYARHKDWRPAPNFVAAVNRAAGHGFDLAPEAKAKLRKAADDWDSFVRDPKHPEGADFAWHWCARQVRKILEEA